MSHVNVEKTVASQIKSVAGAGTAKMMDSTMGKMGMGPMMMGSMGSMMKEGMGPMMKEGMGPMMMGGMGPMMNEGMGSMMKEGMGPMMKGGMGSMMKGGMGSMMKTPGVATGVVVYTGSNAGKSVRRKIFTHPLVLFGLGVVVGCYVYKYRKSIISTSVETQPEE
jgi:hypothetical protein